MQLNDNRSYKNSNKSRPTAATEATKIITMKSNPGEVFNGKEIAKSKAEERQQKLSKIRRKQYSRLLYVAFAIACILLCLYEIYHSSFLDVKRIKVTGNKYVSSEIVKQKCNISKSTNILRVPTASIQQKLLKDPWIKSVSVGRVFPNTLQIDIEERTPIAKVSLGNKFYLVDNDQFIISSSAYADSHDLPVIADLPVTGIKVGDRFINPSLKNAIACLAAMDISFKKTINLISASSVNKLSLYNKDNIEILYGDAKLAGEKNKVISGILKKQGKQVIFIDIRSYPQTDPVLRRLDAAP
jgi:cell division protein FtsQ